jgi:hypothetical protein
MLSRWTTLFLTVTITKLACVIPLCIAGEATELVIENSPQNTRDGDIKAELHGVRAVTTSPKFLESAADGVTVPENVIVEAVKGSPDLQKTLNLPTDPNEFTFSMIAEAAHSAQGRDLRWKPSNQTISGIYCGIPKSKTKNNGWRDLSCDDNSNYNSETVTRLLLNGGLDINDRITNNVNGQPIRLVVVQPSYASVL